MKKNFKLISLVSSSVFLLSGCGQYYYNQDGQENTTGGGGGNSGGGGGSASYRYVVLDAMDDDAGCYDFGGGGMSSSGSSGLLTTSSNNRSGARIFAYTADPTTGQLQEMISPSASYLYAGIGGQDASFRGINVTPDGLCYYPSLREGGNISNTTVGFAALRYDPNANTLYKLSLPTYSPYHDSDDVYAFPNPNPSSNSNPSSDPVNQFMLVVGNINNSPSFQAGVNSASYPSPSSSAVLVHKINSKPGADRCKLYTNSSFTSVSGYSPFIVSQANVSNAKAAVFNDSGTQAFILSSNGSLVSVVKLDFNPVTGALSNQVNSATTGVVSNPVNREIWQVPAATNGQTCLFYSSYSNISGGTIYSTLYSGTFGSILSKTTTKKVSSLNVNHGTDTARYLYATMRDGSVYKYTINTASCALTLSPSTPIATEQSPYSSSMANNLGSVVASVNQFYSTGILKMPPLSASSTEYAYEGLFYEDSHNNFFRGYPLDATSSYVFGTQVSPLIAPYTNTMAPNNSTNGIAVGVVKY